MAYLELNSDDVSRGSIQTNDAIIEQYVRDPASLPASVRSTLETLLERDTGAQRVEAFYRSFYEELDRLPSQPPSRVDAFIASIFPSPHVIPLVLIERRNAAPGTSAEMAVPSLGHDTGKLLFDPLVMLGSHAAGVAVYVLRDREVHEYCRLCVAMMDAPRRSNMIVTFPDLDLDVFVRHHATHFLAPSGQPDAERFKAAILRFPTYELEYANNQLSSTFLSSARGDSIVLPTGHILQVREAFGTFRLVMDPGDAEYPTSIRRIAIVTDTGSSHVINIVSGRGELSIEKPVDHAWIGLYE